MKIEDIPSVWDLPDDPYRLPGVASDLYHPSFAELAALEPALAELADDARREHERARAADYYCANFTWVWYLKPRFAVLVGWESRHPAAVMRSEEAYAVAYDTIYELLPDCKNCGCMR